ncbi:MAG: hypothetical protein RBS43_10930, partial [Candidatus Cloacimonas sp.]|nr:hypothetical protein [Candidatus Cloacimonas sp.]
MKRLSCFLLLVVALLLPLFAETIAIGNGNVLNQGLPIEPIARYSYSQQLFLASEIGLSGLIDSLSFKYSETSNLFFEGIKEWKIWLGHSSRMVMGSWMPLDSLYLVYNGMLSPSYFDGGLPGNGWLHIPLQQSFYYNGNANLVLAVDENTYEYGSSSDDFICTNVSQQRAIQFQSQTTNPNPAEPPVSGFTYKTHRSNLRISLQPQYFAPAMPSPANGATGIDIDTNLSWVSISDYFTLRLGTHPDSLQIIEEHLSQCLWQPTAPFACNRTYYWQVTGNYLGQPYPSAVWSFSTYNDAISPPLNLSGFYDGQVVQLSWQIPQTGTVQYYRIYRNSQPYALCTSTTWNEANVQGGVTYFYN